MSATDVQAGTTFASGHIATGPGGTIPTLNGGPAKSFN